MTIKEIEQHSGLERASIRFYEQQGLLSPGRAENGYRDYSPQDLVTLERVRFLRSLGFGVQEILSFQREERALNEALPGRIRVLEGEQRDRERACRICRELQADHASYQTLETERYLRASEAAPCPRLPTGQRRCAAPGGGSLRGCWTRCLPGRCFGGW